LESWPQADTFFHIDDVAVLRQSVNQGGGELIVPKKAGPFLEPRIGTDQSAFSVVPFMHQGKEQSHLNRLHLHVPKLVDEQRVIRGKSFDQPGLGMIGNGFVQDVHQLREHDEPSIVAVIDGLDEKGRRKARFPRAGGSHPYNILKCLST